MKLFKVADHHEGMYYPVNAMIFVGRCFDTARGRNGFYVMFRSPFVSKNIVQLRSDTFDEVTRDCRKVRRILWRAIKGQDKLSCFVFSSYEPV